MFGYLVIGLLVVGLVDFELAYTAPEERRGMRNLTNHNPERVEQGKALGKVQNTCTQNSFPEGEMMIRFFSQSAAPGYSQDAPAGFFIFCATISGWSFGLVVKLLGYWIIGKAGELLIPHHILPTENRSLKTDN